jgi:hypothetical protein
MLVTAYLLVVTVGYGLLSLLAPAVAKDPQCFLGAALAIMLPWMFVTLKRAWRSRHGA